jgi:hypothetical protein
LEEGKWGVATWQLPFPTGVVFDATQSHIRSYLTLFAHIHVPTILPYLPYLHPPISLLYVSHLLNINSSKFCGGSHEFSISISFMSVFYPENSG